MARSTTRGLLYTAPPTDEEEQAETEPTAETHTDVTAEATGTNRGRSVADD